VEKRRECLWVRKLEREFRVISSLLRGKEPRALAIKTVDFKVVPKILYRLHGHCLMVRCGLKMLFLCSNVVTIIPRNQTVSKYTNVRRKYIDQIVYMYMYVLDITIQDISRRKSATSATWKSQRTDDARTIGYNVTNSRYLLFFSKRP
jgi:hypothetical protein